MRLGVGCLLLLFMALSITEAVGNEETQDLDPRPEDKKKDVREEEAETKKEVEKEPEANLNAGERNGGKSKKRVLIYNPYIGYYHTKFMSTIAISLRDAGHDVTMLNSIVNSKIAKIVVHPEGIAQIKVGQNSETAKILLDGEESPDGLAAFWGQAPFHLMVKGFLGFYQKSMSFGEMLKHQCKDVVNDKEFKNILDKKYDLAITEVFDLCGVGLFDLFENKPSKIILASSVPLHEHLGEMLGLPKSFDVPTKFGLETSSSHRKSFMEFDLRGLIGNAIQSALFGQNMFGVLEEAQTEIFVDHMKLPGKKFQGFRKLLKDAHSLIENVHPLLDLSKPTLNSIIPIGGITVGKPSSITDQEISKTLEKAEKDNKYIVLVSFGTVMSHNTMTEETMKNLLDAFEEVENAFFLWKVDKTMLKSKGIETTPDNVYINDWLPQNDLLGSRKIDLFVSHMGIGSFTEAAYHGVPLVSIPIFVDQHYNYVCANNLGIARWVDKTSLANSPDMLIEAIREALKTGKTSSEQLKDNLNRFGNQTQKMMDHIEFVLSLPTDLSTDRKPTAFGNHHNGFSVYLSLTSLFHLVPYCVVSIVFIGIFNAIFLFRWTFYLPDGIRTAKDQWQKEAGIVVVSFVIASFFVYVFPWIFGWSSLAHIVVIPLNTYLCYYPSLALYVLILVVVVVIHVLAVPYISGIIILSVIYYSKESENLEDKKTK